MRVTLFLAMSLALAVPAAAEPLSIDDVRALAFDKGIVKIEEVRAGRRHLGGRRP